MKYLKILGLAAIAAAALTAFLGAGSASATVLCTENVSPCPVGKTVVELTWSTTGSQELETTGGTVLDTCTSAHIAGSISSQGSGKPAKGPISSLTWSGCTRTTDTLALGELEATQIGTEDKATVVGKGSSVTVNGIFGTSCVYGTGTGTTLGTMVGGKPATLNINALVPRTVANALCPAETRWTASWDLTNHTIVHIVAAATD
ncbi:MAG TPA: hypothetical protein VFJ76_08520 [Solirubrobacterales bacterium]|nr:hypothetical protein [Solirubrobacterales bacterium]